MGQALYRQYRPKSLDEVVGQDHITTTLRNALKSGKISHAYLFTGPKGVGKTSVARILAHEVNQFTYDDNSTHLDIIEIDAASNRRIDEIRDLRDKVHIAPTSGHYKVYIIDEVHMLTKEAFNALLKTLEEPPAHVIFILATTESHKLPETIVSRTQRFSFKPIDNKQVIEHLKLIAKQENISVEEAALKLIADHSDGSFRDSISLLDQASSMTGNVTVEEVRQMLGIAPQEAIDQLLEAMSLGNPKELLSVLNQLEEQGLQPASIAKQLGNHMLENLVDNSPKLDPETTTKLIKKLIAVPASPSPDKLLEIILLEVAFKQASSQINIDKRATVSVEEPQLIEEVKTSIKTTLREPDLDSQIIVGNDFSLDLWPKVLDDIKAHHNTLYGILRMSQPSYKDETLTLAFKFVFHQKRINEPKMHQLITDTLINMGIRPVRITAIVQTGAKPPLIKSKPSVDVTAISNIFGDAEVLES